MYLSTRAQRGLSVSARTVGYNLAARASCGISRLALGQTSYVCHRTEYKSTEAQPR